jgi:hypothetical protein
MRYHVVIIAVLLIVGASGATDSARADTGGEREVTFEIVENDGWDLESYAQDERGVNALTAKTTPQRSLLVLIMHRARESFTEDACDDYFGFDAGGLKIGLGLRYGVLDRLDLGMLRLNGTAETFDTCEFDFRYRFLDQEIHHLDLALRTGISWFKQPEDEDASGFFGQLLASRQCGKRLLIGAGALYHSESSGDRKSSDDEDASAAVLGLVELRFVPWLALVAEVAGNVTGYRDTRPAFSASAKCFTYGHTFSLVVSNTQYVGADGIVANAWRKNDELILGFNITRLIEL